MAVETKSLLTGEAANPKVVARLRCIMKANPGVVAINELKTMHLGPHDILTVASLDFKDSLTAAEVESAVIEMERQIKREFPAIRPLFLGARSSRTAGDGLQ